MYRFATVYRAGRVVATFGIVAAFAGGCSSSKSTSSTTTTGGPTTSANALTLTASDFAFTPTALSTKAGTVHIVLRNDGGVEHNLTVEGLKVNKDIEDGQSANVDVVAKAGTYPFHCEYHPTKMLGTITVTG